MDEQQYTSYDYGHNYELYNTAMTSRDRRQCHGSSVMSAQLIRQGSTYGLWVSDMIHLTYRMWCEVAQLIVNLNLYKFIISYSIK